MNESEPLWPYSERDVTSAPVAVQELLAEPELHFTAAEKLELRAFAQQLFDGDQEAKTPSPSLEQVDKIPVLAASQQYYTDYFRSETGKQVLERLGIRGLADRTVLQRELYAAVAEGTAPDKTARKEVANQSTDWYKATLAERLAEPASHDADQEDSPVLRINFEPDKLLTKFEYLQQYRQYYRTLRAGLKEAGTEPLVIARRQLLDIHVARVNNLVAQLYPHVLQLAEQISQSPPTESVIAWQRRLFNAAPVVRQLYHEGKQAPSTVPEDDLMYRFDLIRNGAQPTDAPGLSPVADVVHRLADELDVSRAEPETIPIAQFSEAELKQFAATRWNADQLKNFCQAVLKEWALDSAYETDWEAAGDRSGPAEDAKWQVVITPKVTAFDTDGPKKILYVPASFDRSLSQVSPTGVLPLVAHELAHVLQNEYDATLAEQVPLAIVKGRRYVTGREMGGIYEERLMQSWLGQNRPTNTTYLRALETKLKGGNQTEVARAFMQAAIGGAELSTAQAKARAKSAGATILRLYRRGGYDSQPLDYIEQELLVRAMDGLTQEQVRAIAICGGSFSLKDAAALHRMGLLDLPNKVEHEPSETVLKIFQEQFQNP